MASLWINQRIKVKEQLELLFRDILGKINQTIQFSNINILQTSILTFPGHLAVTGTLNFSSFIHKTKVQFFWLLYVYA